MIKIRPSTEPLLRVMAEAETDDLCEKMNNRIIATNDAADKLLEMKV